MIGQDILEDPTSWLTSVLPTQEADILALATKEPKNKKEEMLHYPSTSVPSIFQVLQGGTREDLIFALSSYLITQVEQQLPQVALQDAAPSQVWGNGPAAGTQS